jgi:hypothetical protein
MKKYIFAVLAICSLSSGTVKALDIGATDCLVLDASLNDVIMVSSAYGGDTVVHSVNTPSGNTNAHCNGTLPSNATTPSRTMVITSDDNPSTCDTLYGSSRDWHLVLTKNGKANLTCHIHHE